MAVVVHVLAALFAAGIASAVTIVPNVNVLELPQSATFAETLTVTIPAGASVPKMDVYILADTTGSMIEPLLDVKRASTSLVDGLVADLPDVDLAFGVGDFKDFIGGPYAFKHDQSITKDVAAVKDAIGRWDARGGGDVPEGQFYAFDQIAEDRAPSHDGSPAGTIGWRAGAKRILVVLGDAPAHDPVCAAITSTVTGHAVGYDITEALVTAKLIAAGIVFIGVSTRTGPSMDGPPYMWAEDYKKPTPPCPVIGGQSDQATRLAAATGGVHKLGVVNYEIVDVIKAQITAGAQTVNSLSLVPLGATSPFVASISPASHGPLTLDVERVVRFDVVFEGIQPCSGAPQVFTGTLSVLADGPEVTAKAVTITVPACETSQRRGCRTDKECDDCVRDAYCLNFGSNREPYVCHGDDRPRWFPSCAFEEHATPQPSPAFRRGCTTDEECAGCRYGSYCKAWGPAPHVCHGDSAPRWFPGCSLAPPA